MGAKRWVGTKVAAVALAALPACGGAGEGEDVGSTSEAIQWRYVNESENPNAPGKWVNIVNGDAFSQQAQSMGAIRPCWGSPSQCGTPAGTQPGKWADGTQGTCGATFISERFALTAAHCVPANFLPNMEGSPNESRFRVEHINVANVPTWAFRQASDVSGTTWPNWGVGGTLSDGYEVDTISCTVMSRCHSNGQDPTQNFGRQNCPASFGSTVVDIALIFCENRGQFTFTYVDVPSSDNPVNSFLEIWWFHEVLDLREDPNEGPEFWPEPADSWTRYGTHNAGNLTNFHYVTPNDPEHQLIPLRSSRWNNGTSYKHLGAVPSTTLNKTDAAGCHGTSGSGVLGRGSTQTIGVTNSKGGSWNPNPFPGSLDDRLCADMDTATPGSDILRFIQHQYVRKYWSTTWVQNDL